MNKRLFGCHVSAAGGLATAVRNARELGVNTIQIHASPPQRWNGKPFPQGIEEEFLKLLPESGVEKVFFHGIYLINLATANELNLQKSEQSLVHTLDLLSRLGGSGLIFHLGSLKDHSDEKVGYRQAADAINRVLDTSTNNAKLILEVAAGSGSVIGDRVEELAEIYAMVENKERVGFGLDSQHMWASGYDLVTDLEGVIRNIEQVLTLEKVWAIHLNDSKTDLGSRIDRHENLGDGKIGFDALGKLFLHPKLFNIPVILETPSMKELELAKKEVAKLSELMKSRAG